MDPLEPLVIEETAEVSSGSAESIRVTLAKGYAVESLVPHPAVAKLCIPPSTQELSHLSLRGEAVYLDPIWITKSGVILDGISVWHLAKLQKRQTVLCIAREMTEEEALLFIIDRNRASKGIGDFNRILMALELEPWFKARAKTNQQNGGRWKGSSELTEAKSLDVRTEIATAAGVSAGNVSKVKQILRSAIPELQESLRMGEVSINKGAEWAEAPAGTQRSRLASLSTERGIGRTIRFLLDKHRTHRPLICEGLRDIRLGLGKLQGEVLLTPLLPLLERLICGVDQLLCQAEGRNRAA